MRIITILLLALFSTSAFSAKLPGLVFGYECKMINKEDVGFTCEVKTEGAQTTMFIHFKEDPKKMPKPEREYKEYRYNALLLRYFDLGGVFVEMTYAWAPNKKNICNRWKKRRFAYVCN